MINPNTIDLNLLRVFEALLVEGSVSGAANRLALSQPAVSNALKRLRVVADDRLFVRTRRGMEPTAMAVLLRDSIQTGLATIRAGLVQSNAFDPASSRRNFVLLMNDLGASTILTHLLALIQATAPGVDVTIMDRDYEDYQAVLDSGEADLAVGRIALSSAFRSQLLFRSRYLAVFWRGHKRLGQKKRLTLQAYLAEPHIMLYPRGVSTNPIDILLDEMKAHRRIALRLPHAAALAHILPRSNLIATVPDRYAALLTLDPQLVSTPLPFDAPETRVHQWWHKRYDNDAGHRWLRDLSRRACGSSDVEG